MNASICIASYDKPAYLERTLRSIVAQSPPFDWELLVVDDGSPNSETWRVCADYPAVTYFRRDREPGYRNPAAARNVAYRAATGEVLICQSDDVIHAREDTIERLVASLTPGTMAVATVINVNGDDQPYADPLGKGFGDNWTVYTSPEKRRPLFFLGALYRSDLYAVGGNDEDFVDPTGEDRWLGMCLTRGLGLSPVYLADVVGHHQHHGHCEDYAAIDRSQRLAKQKIKAALRGETGWCSSGGPWM